jgi:hypothetical protein
MTYALGLSKTAACAVSLHGPLQLQIWTRFPLPAVVVQAGNCPWDLAWERACTFTYMLTYIDTWRAGLAQNRQQSNEVPFSPLSCQNVLPWSVSLLPFPLCISLILYIQPAFRHLLLFPPHCFALPFHIASAGRTSSYTVVIPFSESTQGSSSTFTLPVPLPDRFSASLVFWLSSSPPQVARCCCNLLNVPLRCTIAPNFFG